MKRKIVRMVLVNLWLVLGIGGLAFSGAWFFHLRAIGYDPEVALISAYGLIRLFVWPLVACCFATWVFLWSLWRPSAALKIRSYWELVLPMGIVLALWAFTAWTLPYRSLGYTPPFLQVLLLVLTLLATIALARLMYLTYQPPGDKPSKRKEYGCSVMVNLWLGLGVVGLVLSSPLFPMYLAAVRSRTPEAGAVVALALVGGFVWPLIGCCFAVWLLVWSLWRSAKQRRIRDWRELVLPVGVTLVLLAFTVWNLPFWFLGPHVLLTILVLLGIVALTRLVYLSFLRQRNESDSHAG